MAFLNFLVAQQGIQNLNTPTMRCRGENDNLELALKLARHCGSLEMERNELQFMKKNLPAK